jgi:hypothetical protein
MTTFPTEAPTTLDQPTAPDAPVAPTSAPAKPAAPAVAAAAAAPAAPREKPENPYADAYANFLEETADHTLRVILDDGLNRQMRVGAPGTGMWSWRVITWPGYLATYGDIADGFMFNREADMIGFFDSRGYNSNYYSDGAPCIDFRYWAEKLSGGRDMKEYSSEAFIRHVKDVISENEDLGDDAEAEYQKIVEVTKRVCARHDVDYDEYVAEMQEKGRGRDLEIDEENADEVEYFEMKIPRKSPAERGAAILADAELYADNEHEAHEFLQSNTELFGEDWWEANLRDFNIHFVFSCYAIELSVRLWREYEASDAAKAHRALENYVTVEGGLVRNNTALPVFDLDVLDSDLCDEDAGSEALDLYKRIAEHPQASVAMTETLGRTAGFIRAYGSAEDIASIDDLEEARLSGEDSATEKKVA